MENRLNRYIERIYTTPSNPASFSSADALLAAVRRRFPRVTRKRIQNFLDRQNAYTMHRKTWRRFPRRQTFGSAWRAELQIDLADMNNVAEFNTVGGVQMKWLLTAIDCFARFAWAVPIPDKRPTTVREALKSIFVGFLPLAVYSDDGTEFKGAVDAYFRENQIRHIVMRTDLKCALVERLNRTIKSKLYKIFTHRWMSRPFHYLDVLPDVMRSINGRVNPTTGRTPASVGPFTRMHLVPTPHSKAKFAVGEHVRTSRVPDTFNKGYMPTYTAEYFVVDRVAPTSPPTYHLRDLKGEKISGVFYGRELVRVDPQPDDYYKIEKIGERTRGRRKEYLVHYWGWPDKFDEWIPAEKARDLPRS
jgi:hypothetical protein